MNTAVNIPWDAVVQGGPSSADKRLPLVVSDSCRTDGVVTLVARLEDSLRSSMAMISRSAFSSLLELPLPDEGVTAILTSDGEKSVILQYSVTLRKRRSQTLRKRFMLTIRC